MAKRYTCGQMIPSSCVPYTGKDLKFLSEEEQVSCDANMDEVIDKISIAIDSIKKATDVSSYTYDCLGTISNPTITKISQAQTYKLCALQASLESLQQQFAELNIGSELITIDLGSLGGAVSACQVSANTYSLISVLNLFKNEIIAIKSELGL